MQRRPDPDPREVKPNPAPSPAGSITLRERRERLRRKSTLKRVTPKELSQFTSGLSVLLDAGIPIARALKILEHQMRPCLLREIINCAEEDIENGCTLSEAMAYHPKVFDYFYVSMVRAGETGGVLDLVLHRLALFLEKVEEIKRTLIRALTYPVIVITVAIVVVLVIVTVVIPRFSGIFAQLGRKMPSLTQGLVDFSMFVKTYFPVLIAIPFLLFLAYRLCIRTAKGRLIFDRIKLGIPLIGEIVRKATVARFCRTLGTMLQSGVPIIVALKVVRGATGNEAVAQAIDQAHAKIREGESIAGPLAESGAIDSMVRSMVEIGEETGQLDMMLQKVADSYEQDVDARLNALKSILEPVLILSLGGIVGFLVLALLIPLVQIIQTLSAIH